MEDKPSELREKSEELERKPLSFSSPRARAETSLSCERERKTQPENALPPPLQPSALTPPPKRHKKLFRHSQHASLAAEPAAEAGHSSSAAGSNADAYARLASNPATKHVTWPRFLNAPLSEVDPALVDIIEREKNRQWKGLELIPSENFVSSSVMEAVGSVMTNKYSEGYPGETEVWCFFFRRYLFLLLLCCSLKLSLVALERGFRSRKRKEKLTFPLKKPKKINTRRPLLRRQRVHRPGRDPLPAARAGGLRPRPGEVGRQRAVAVGLSRQLPGA